MGYSSFFTSSLVRNSKVHSQRMDLLVEAGAVKPTPWPRVLDLLVEILTEKGAPVRLINLESSTIEEEPMGVQVPAMKTEYLRSSSLAGDEGEGGARNGDHTKRLGACTQRAFD